MNNFDRLTECTVIKSFPSGLIAPVCAIVSLIALSSAPAATLTNVPMQGAMAMPMVSYHASDGSVRVMMPPAVPQLTPLTVSNPGDGFDPADPWFESLDPSGQGLAFSRRYGFNMDTTSDPLPDGTAIWIRKVSSSPGLGAYRYRASGNKVWEPIFGTAGSGDTFAWDQTMFHPAFTASPGTNVLEATFELLLVDATTGELVAPGSRSGPITFRWTDVPDGRPALAIASRILIQWTPTASNYTLEAADELPAPVWTAVTNAPVLIDGQVTVILDAAFARKIFRLRLLP